MIKLKLILLNMFFLLIGCSITNKIKINTPLSQETISTQSNDMYYKIKKITPYGYVYILEVEQDNSNYLVLTENNKITNLLCKNPIKEGESYLLVLEKIDIYAQQKERKDYNPDKFIPRDIEGIIYNETSISFSEFSKDLYSTNSLKGLCLTENYNLPQLNISK